MSKMIQLRHVSDDMHRALKARAALAGMSLSDYLIAELGRTLDRPTAQELVERLRGRRPVVLKRSVANLLREERERR